jgi:hypothetical protein
VNCSISFNIIFESDFLNLPAIFFGCVMATPTSSLATASSSVSSATASCTTAVPGKYGYVPPDACNANWNFNPSFAAAVAFAVLFGMAAVGHGVQGVVMKKVRFCYQDLQPEFTANASPEILLGHCCCLSVGNCFFHPKSEGCARPTAAWILYQLIAIAFDRAIM